jgi:MYXO-CTERM domain-containing protein
MRAGACIAVVGAAILLGATAWANPISMDVLRAKQLPSLTHVQLTYGLDGKTPDTPTIVKRDDVVITGSWTSTASYTANTGSGLKSLQATQLCDCNVSLGAHTYKVTVKNAMGTGTVEQQTTLTVATTQPPPKDAGPGDLSPWEIPEPTQMQGLDCAKACAASTPDGAVKRDAAAVQADTGTTKPKDGGGCSVAGQSSASALALLLGLGLLVALLRRR